MKKWILWILEKGDFRAGKRGFSPAQRVGIAACVLFAVVGQLWRLSDPYWLAFETGFQELIARRHIDPGLSLTHGLSTLNNLGPESTFHATHPPLLQLTLAGLFAAFGESEAAARIVPIGSFWLMLWGIWKLTRSLSPTARIGALASALIIPLSFYVGRIVNFEAPTLACIVLTLVCLDSLNQSDTKRTWIALIFLGIIGTLIDWPYALFVTCLFACSGLRTDRSPQYNRAVRMLWILSMSVALLYVATVWSAGVLSSMTQHARLQTGMAAADQKFQLPPLLTSLEWWRLLIKRLALYGTPVFPLAAALGLFPGTLKKRFRDPLRHECFVLFIFCASYLGLFSRASHNHLWCLFYVCPFLSLSFGLLMNRVKPRTGYLLLGIAAVFAAPVTWDLRFQTPLRDSVQMGRAISSAAHCLPGDKRAPLESPLLYVNRVDPLPYYSHCETAFSHLSVWISAPEKFLVRCRPEFVVLSGFKRRPSITVRPEYSQELFDRLNKSYALVHQQENMELWESLWSPYLSLLGLLETPDNDQPQTYLIDDGVETHIGLRAPRSRSPLVFDLRRASQPGKRWLHGWVIAKRPPSLDPIRISASTGEGEILGEIQAIPQAKRPRWQEFWLRVGDLPEKLLLSWDQGSLTLGDLRLMNESLWATDLSRLLASEIHRRIKPNANQETYNETLELQENGQKIPVVLQHPGFGVDSVDLPPMRIGLNQEMTVQCGLSPSAYPNSDGVTFRLSVFDHALGRKDTLMEVSIDPKRDSIDQAWRTQRISMEDYSRHVLVFTFEVTDGASGNPDNDQAIWREIKLTGLGSR